MRNDRHPLYILGDADRVGERLEGLLLANDLENLGLLSRKLSKAIQLIADELALKMGAEIVMAGGDDILLHVSAEMYDKRLLEEAANDYQEQTGLSMSFGVGSTLEQAYINLRRAKSSRTEKVIER